MTSSLTSQRTALEALTNLRSHHLVAAGVARSRDHGELLLGQIKDAAATFRHVADDERIRRYLEKLTRP